MAQLFSQRHYRAIARVLADRYEDYTRSGQQVSQGLEEASDALACLFEEDSPKFNRLLFMAVVKGELSVNARLPRGGDD